MMELPCPPDDWPRFTALLDAALDLPEASRAVWLDGLAEDDARFRPWLARVVGETTASDAEVLVQPPQLTVGGFAAGGQIGPYRLMSLLGEGGMGEVWRASRGDDGPRREVALKLPHAAFLAGPFQQHFSRERDVLAALSHPHIAQLYDAGISTEGQPYLALELVRGEPITDGMRAQQASLEQRVDLVRQVLAGLSYAHQRLIVHRDIKPANVLVTPDGRVKLLDFGIAKLLGAEAQPDAALTGMARLATPAYAAPEQLGGGDITVVTDIFSVGVLLFELCTGHRPFVRVPAESGAAEAAWASHRVDTAAAGLGGERVARRRLRGDLDAVIARALALHPAARYPSADAFDADLGRWREGLPVHARRSGWAARLRKFIRRHRLGVALAGVLALSLAGGMAGVAWQAERAERQAARAAAIKDFLFGLLDTGSPQAGGRRSDAITLRDLLDAGADRTEKAFAGDPVTEMEVLERFGGIFDEIEEDGRAEQVYTRRLDIARRLYGAADPRVLNAALDLADFESHNLDFARAQAVLEGVRGPLLQTYGEDSIFYGAWLQVRAESLRSAADGRAEMLADLQAAVAIFARHPLEPGATLATIAYSNALFMLVKLQLDADQTSKALAAVQTMGALHEAANPKSAAAHMSYLIELGLCLERLGKLDAADAVYHAAQRQAEQVIGKHGGYYLNALMHRVTLADLRGDTARADALFHSPGADLSHKTSLPERTRGAALARDGRAAEAVALLEPALAQARRQARDEDTVRVTEGVLGDAYDQLGRTDDARRMLAAARDEWASRGAPGAAASLAAEERWGRFLLDHGETAPAASSFKAVLAQSPPGPSAPAALAQAGAARVALAGGRIEEAEAASARAVDLLAALQVEYDVRIRIEIWSARAEALAAAGRLPAARDWAVKAISTADATCAAGTKDPRRAHALLARITDLQERKL